MIYGEQVRLRSIERGDLPHFVAWLNDPEVRQGLALYLPISNAEEESWFENILKESRDERPFAIEVEGGEGWKMIGSCGFLKIEWRNQGSEVGILIGDKSCWNQGYGTQVMRLLLRHGFATLNLHRVYLRVFDNNPRAIRAYEKAGFVHEGRMRQAEFRDGRYLDVLIMSVLRPEWLQQKTSDKG